MDKIVLVLLTALCCNWQSQAYADFVDGFDKGQLLDEVKSADDAVELITERLREQHFEIIAVIDHSANAAGVDLQLPPTRLIMFRKRRREMALVRRNATIGIDLPEKILVWQEADSNKVRIDYNSAGYLSERHRFRIKVFPLKGIDRTLMQFGKLENGLIITESPLSVQETVDNLKAVLLENGFFIPFTFQLARERGLYRTPTRNSQLIIFGNPRIGTQLMQNRQSIGLDLPQKYLVWEGRDGIVRIAHNDPRFLAKRHGVQGLDNLLSNIANRLQQLVQLAISR